MPYFGFSKIHLVTIVYDSLITLFTASFIFKVEMDKNNVCIVKKYELPEVRKDNYVNLFLY